MKLCPAPTLPEYAFIGRSNVGKSSLINMITGEKGLAKTSAKPGKTQLINHFLIDGSWYLVDLPGYGYAQLGKEKKEAIERIIADYMLRRSNLMCVFVLIDVRHSVQRIDREFMEWLAKKEVAFVIAFTKGDKLGKVALIDSIEKYKNEMLKTWEDIPQTFATSAFQSTGREDILAFVQETNKLFVLPNKKA